MLVLSASTIAPLLSRGLMISSAGSARGVQTVDVSEGKEILVSLVGILTVQ